jgi:hypothetical protein
MAPLSVLVGSILEADLKLSRLSSLYDLKASRHNSKSFAEKMHRRTSELAK